MSFRLAIPSELRGAVDAATADWQANHKIERLWKKDPSLWTRDGEEKWMGWLDIVERQQKDLSSLAVLGGDVRSAGFKSALLLGMGGSSLCPEVLAKTFGQQPDFPALHIVDSTDPAEVMAACGAVDLGEALVIVASKSGTTLEPNILKQFFYEQVRRVVGAENVGTH
ncbi:MAG: transaldolase, partial [Terracidiphilus sp.]